MTARPTLHTQQLGVADAATRFDEAEFFGRTERGDVEVDRRDRTLDVQAGKQLRMAMPISVWGQAQRYRSFAGAS